MRMLMKTLLASELSTEDLLQLSRQLKQPEFAHRLSQLIESTCSSVPSHLEQPPVDARQFRDAIVHADLPKKVVAEMMSEVMQHQNWQPNTRDPIEEMVHSFIEVATRQDLNAFLARLSQKRSPDPYLESLIKKRESP